MTAISYPIIEIFKSIQGEGYFMGTPAGFIRFKGCNLNCSFCDTPSRNDKGAMLTIEEIIKRMEEHDITNFVVLTGGEPTIHDLIPLLEAIKHRFPDIFITIETNGTSDMGDYKQLIDWITCSPKPPFYKYTIYSNELKYVVTEEFDPQVIPTGIKHWMIWLQPDQNNLEFSLHKCLGILEDYPRLRLGAQLHYLYKLK